MSLNNHFPPSLRKPNSHPTHSIPCSKASILHLDENDLGLFSGGLKTTQSSMQTSKLQVCNSSNHTFKTRSIYEMILLKPPFDLSRILVIRKVDV